MQSARFIVIPREGCSVSVNKYTEEISWYQLSSEHLQFPGVSSTEVRENKRLDYVSDRVKKYIVDNNLYDC